jgi:hypothetical protein
MGNSMITFEEVVKRLKGIVHPDFSWPEVPAGWQLEFIAHTNEDVDMDLLHPVSASFWSDDNDYLDPPIMLNGKNITASALQKAGVPFMTSFGIAATSVKPLEPHLTLVSNN